MKQTLQKTSAGFFACVAIALLAQALAKIFPTVGAAIFAIGIGIFCGNTFLNKKCFEAGTAFSERTLLEYSIVLTGATLMLGDIFSVGLHGVIFIFCQMAVTIVFCYLIGRTMKFNRQFCLLMGAGNAVCGSSAIATVSPVIKANSKDKGISITVVNLTGTFLMIALPLITGTLYNHQLLPTTAMMGGVLQSIGQVIASADLVGEEYIPTATIFKIIRIVFIVLVALAFSFVNHTEEGKLFEKNHEKAGAFKVNIPWFIIGFFITALLYTFHIIPQSISHIAHTISGQFEIIALAAIGMRVKFSDLINEGPKAFCYGLFVGVGQVILAFLLIKLFLHF